MVELDRKQDQLLASLRELESCAVAYSGGVDSAVVAKAAFLALGKQAIAVTGVSFSLAAGELEAAAKIARLIGIEHRVIQTSEFAQEGYTRNAPDRCYHCKTELYTQLEQLLPQLGVATIVNGANADDVGDYRPGMQAAGEHRVHSPLLECGITKSEVRQLASRWGLPVWDKPASPCLSSRVAYGQEVNPQRLAMIDRAEQFLRQHAFRICRVRYLGGDVARIEVPLAEVARLCEPPLREAVEAELLRLGFRSITIDPAGFRSGSLNELIQLNAPPRAGG
ncbi:MAG TPA: ATP-dependent sacrificial sulfur transferase LarE [Pirellulaceae bacterium]|nr:ATP-dependent sacrificial sulfur transferase LarE [Pirellulaceae bacterium]